MPARNVASAWTAAGCFQFADPGLELNDPASETLDLSIARVRCNISGLGPRRPDGFAGPRFTGFGAVTGSGRAHRRHPQRAGPDGNRRAPHLQRTHYRFGVV